MEKLRENLDLYGNLPGLNRSPDIDENRPKNGIATKVVALVW